MPDGPGQSHYFGGGVTDQVINPIVLVAMLLAVILIFSLPRKHVIGPVLFIVFLVPLGQQFYAFGVHWLVGRIIVLAGLARVASGKKGGIFPGGFNSVDKAFVGTVLCEAVAFILLYKDSQAVINQFGVLIDLLGAYTLMRALVQDDAGVYRAIKWLAFLCVILAITMVHEQQNLENPFGLLGGVRVVPEIRENKIRSQGVFQHSLTAGTFAATLVPLFFLLWRNGKAKPSAAVGLAGCTVMTICSNSSTPLLAYAAGIFAVCLWPIRERMRKVRWALVISLVVLHMVMKAPVWFLLARIDLTGGSSGYHRAELVDQCIRHFWDWWLIGTKDAGTWADDMWDSQNQYVQVAETGGLAALVFMIVMVKRLYANLGNARKEVAKSLVKSKEQQWSLWLLGSALFAHLTAFFGINYFDQSRIGWFLLLVAISVFAGRIMQGGPREDPAAEPEFAASTAWAFQGETGVAMEAGAGNR